MDHLGLDLALLIALGAVLWIGLIYFVVTPRRKGFDPQGKERVGINEPSEFEHWRGEREAAAARGRAHAERSRRRRVSR